MDMASARNPIKCSETHRLISAVFSSIRLVSPDPSRFRRDSTRPGAQLIVIVVSSESGIATCDGLEATAAPTNVETATVAIMSAVSVTGGPPDYCIGGAAGGAGGAGRAGISWSISCTQSMQLNWVQIVLFHTYTSIYSRSDLGVMSLSARGFARETELGEARETGRELRPLAVEQDAAQVQDALGALTPPAHARAVEAHSYQVANGAFDDAASDDEVVCAQLCVPEPLLMILEEAELGFQAGASPFVPGSCLGNGCQAAAQCVEDGGDAPLAQCGRLLADPLLQLGRTLLMEDLPGFPEPLDDVVPVETDLSQREVLLLAPPDVVRSVGEEEGPFGTARV